VRAEKRNNVTGLRLKLRWCIFPVEESGEDDTLLVEDCFDAEGGGEGAEVVWLEVGGSGRAFRKTQFLYKN
jgi:hypothetical protein